MSSIRILRSEEIDQLVKMSDAITLMREAFAELSSGKAIVPQRLSMELSEEKGRALVMPVYSPNKKRYGLKVVTLSDNNPARGLPFIHGLLMVFDADTGVPLGMMDAARVTALRTGAASGLATDLLARTDAEIAVIFGAGTQARTQLEGITAVRKIRKVYVYSVEISQAKRYAKEMQKKLGLEIVVADSPGIVSEADIVCTATTSRTPVFRHEDLKSGVHINGIGSYRPDTREIPGDTIAGSTVVVDSRESCFAEAGDLIIPMNEGLIAKDHIYAELGEIVLGQRRGRSSPEQVTIFKSVGNAVQDLAVASHVIRVAEEKGLGTVVEL